MLTHTVPRQLSQGTAVDEVAGAGSGPMQAAYTFVVFGCVAATATATHTTTIPSP